MNNINMTIKDLKNIIEGLPDNMPVIIPVIDYDDANSISGFRHVRTAGILSTDGYDDALCLNAAADGVDIKSQVGMYDSDISCDKVLF